jgi:hypothetical protein
MMFDVDVDVVKQMVRSVCEPVPYTQELLGSIPVSSNPGGEPSAGSFAQRTVALQRGCTRGVSQFCTAGELCPVWAR